jgi:CBS domain-containing protein
MICPNCGYDNLPGSEECGRCLQDLTQLDRPMANNRVERSLMEDPVGQLNPRVPVTLPATATLREAIATLLGRDIGALIVVDAQQKLLGIFSERDLLKKVAGLSEVSLDKPVGSFMTPKPETVSSTDTLAFALHKMDVGGYRHLPVLSGDRVVGVVSVRDMLRHITHLCR